MKPLQNKRILITRPEDQSKKFIELIESEGAIAVSLPVFKITEPEDKKAVIQSLKDTEAFSSIIFTSARAVKYFFLYAPKTIQLPRIIAIGNKTADALFHKNIKVDYTPEHYTGAHLSENLPIEKNEEILYPCSSLSKGKIKKKLEQRGAKVTQIAVYQNIENYPSSEEINKIFNQPLDFIIFTSGSAVRGLLKIKPEIKAESSAKIVCIGPATAEVVRQKGLFVNGIADSHNIEGIIQKMKLL